MTTAPTLETLLSIPTITIEDGPNAGVVIRKVPALCWDEAADFAERGEYEDTKSADTVYAARMICSSLISPACPVADWEKIARMEPSRLQDLYTRVMEFTRLDGRGDNVNKRVDEFPVNGNAESEESDANTASVPRVLDDADSVAESTGE